MGTFFKSIVACGSLAVLLMAADVARADSITFRDTSSATGIQGANLADKKNGVSFSYVSGDIQAKSLGYTAFGLTVTGGTDLDNDGVIETSNATGANEFKNVIQDLVPWNGGLGVLGDGGNDEVNAVGTDPDQQILILTFDKTVGLTEAGFRNRDHGSTFDSRADFQLWVDGVDKGLFDLASAVAFSSTYWGKVFAFGHVGSATYNDFYLGSVNVSPVPEPATLSLVGAALGLGALAKRRRARRAAVQHSA